MSDTLEQTALDLLSLPDFAIALFNKSPDAIVVVGEHGLIKLVNEQAELLFGYHRSELRGHSVEILLPESVKDTHTSHRATYNDDPKPRAMGVGLTLKARRKDGIEIRVEINLAPVMTSKGAFTIATIRRRH